MYDIKPTRHCLVVDAFAAWVIFFYHLGTVLWLNTLSYLTPQKISFASAVLESSLNTWRISYPIRLRFTFIFAAFKSQTKESNARRASAPTTVIRLITLGKFKLLELLWSHDIARTKLLKILIHSRVAVVYSHNKYAYIHIYMQNTYWRSNKDERRLL